jgi:hypothetical protein
MTCQHDQCENEARVAVRTTRPARGDLKTTIHWDDRSAPKTAEPLCASHLLTLLEELAGVLA